MKVLTQIGDNPVLNTIMSAVLSPVNSAMSSAIGAVNNLGDIHTPMRATMLKSFGGVPPVSRPGRPPVPGVNFDSAAMKDIAAKLNANKAGLDRLFSNTSLFCSSANAQTIDGILKQYGMDSMTWAGLVPPSNTGVPMLGFSQSSTFTYKNGLGIFTQSYVTDYKGNLGRFVTIALGVSTARAQLVGMSKSLSVEFYPHITLDALTAFGWGLGLSGVPGPLDSLSAMVTATSATVPAPDLSHLVGVSLGLPNPPPPPTGVGVDNAKTAISPSVGYTWKL